MSLNDPEYLQHCRKLDEVRAQKISVDDVVLPILPHKNNMGLFRVMQLDAEHTQLSSLEDYSILDLHTKAVNLIRILTSESDWYQQPEWDKDCALILGFEGYWYILDVVFLPNVDQSIMTLDRWLTRGGPQPPYDSHECFGVSKNPLTAMAQAWSYFYDHKDDED